MKVTTGSAKGRRLSSVPGSSTRPVTDRVKQAIFNILMDDVKGSRWLDLFGGTGAIGIEALSRGAEHVTFVDIEPAAIKTIQANLGATGVAAKAKVIRQDAFKYLAAPPNAVYDFIYVAPPQYQDLWSKAIEILDRNPDWLDGTGAIIVQIDPREYRALALDHLELVEERRYGHTLVIFYERRVG